MKNNSKNGSLYDLDPNENKLNIVNILDNKNIDIKTKIKSFNEVMYKLTFEDRQYLLCKYKKIFEQDELLQKYPNVVIRQEKKLKEIFILLIKDLLNNNAEVGKQLLETKYFVETQESNIPFLEGTEEYIFSNLINDIYDTFITKSNYPSNKKDKAIDEYKYLSNIINKKIPYPVIKPITIKHQIMAQKNDDMEIEKENNKEKKLPKKLDYNKYHKKLNLLKPILELYVSEEFQKKYDEYFLEYPELNEDKKIKFIYEIILESLLYYSLNFNEVGKKKIFLILKEFFMKKKNKKYTYSKIMNLI